MARNDIQIIRNGGDVVTMEVDDRTTSSDTAILAGEAVGKTGAAANVVAHVATATPTNASGATMWGLATKDSTETSTVNGKVDVRQVIPGSTVMRAKATTPANLAEGVRYDSVTFTWDGTNYTVNEDEGDDPNVHGLIIIDMDTDKGTVDFLLKGYANEQTSSY